jgi:hypothetical protein
VTDGFVVVVGEGEGIGDADGDGEGLVDGVGDPITQVATVPPTVETARALP